MFLILRNSLLNATRCGKLLNSEMNTCLHTPNSVKMSLTRGQSAWAILNSGPSETQRSAFSTKCKISNKRDFESWLVGFTDGDGDFSFAHYNGKWTFTFKLSQSTYNLRVLNFVKAQVGVGRITIVKEDGMAYYRVRNREHLFKYIIPIFDKHLLLTIKYFKYDLFKKALLVDRSDKLTKDEKHCKLKELYEKYQTLSTDQISPVWNVVHPDLLNVTIAKNVITKFWLIGFTEAKGSFYIYRKDVNRLAHAFEITQKYDIIVLQGIALILDLKVIRKKFYNTVKADNLKHIETVINYFSRTMKGMKSFEYKIWTRSFRKRKRGYEYLKSIQTRMQIVRSKR